MVLHNGSRRRSRERFAGADGGFILPAFATAEGFSSSRRIPGCSFELRFFGRGLLVPQIPVNETGNGPFNASTQFVNRKSVQFDGVCILAEPSLETTRSGVRFLNPLRWEFELLDVFRVNRQPSHFEVNP